MLFYDFLKLFQAEKILWLYEGAAPARICSSRASALRPDRGIAGQILLFTDPSKVSQLRIGIITKSVLVSTRQLRSFSRVRYTSSCPDGCPALPPAQL